MKRIQTRVARDLTKYTENFFFGMSVRQTLLSIAGVAAVALSYIFLLLPGLLAVACGIPFFALAFFRPDGLPAEKWLVQWVRANLARPRIRTNIPRNDLYEFLWHGVLCGRRVLKDRELEAAAKERRKDAKIRTEGAAPRSAKRAACDRD